MRKVIYGAKCILWLSVVEGLNAPSSLSYLLLYVAFNSQDHIAMGILQVEETSS